MKKIFFLIILFLLFINSSIAIDYSVSRLNCINHYCKFSVSEDNKLIANLQVYDYKTKTICTRYTYLCNNYNNQTNTCNTSPSILCATTQKVLINLTDEELQDAVDTKINLFYEDRYKTVTTTTLAPTIRLQEKPINKNIVDRITAWKIIQEILK